MAVPEYIAAMDVAVVSSEIDAGFHYSPIKLREYLACGRPVVAPRVGEVELLLTDGVDALLVTPGHPEALAEGNERLYRDELLRSELGHYARMTALKCSWESQVKRVWDRLQTDASEAT
jgi:glycosyltransferase involved in cell wall biosynthesis